LACLKTILAYNAEHGLGFFRLSSDIIPFASHPVCKEDWAKTFKKEFSELGEFIRKHQFRISMHPDQFTLINSPSEAIWRRSVAELQYHADMLDAMSLGQDAKIQIHGGGVYGDKPSALDRFAKRHSMLSPSIRHHLVVENDDRLFSLKDCLLLHGKTGIPILFDSFHHSILNNGETLKEALGLAAQTWTKADGPMMCDYSSQESGARVGTHTEHIDPKDFAQFLKVATPFGPDVMLEIKDKEKSALEAVELHRRSMP
jgi:UV DNA damage endonuclease